MLITKLAQTRKIDRELSRDVRSALVESLYAPFASLVVGAISGVIVGLMASYRAADPWLVACSAAIFLIGVARVVSAMMYRRYKPGLSPDEVRRWERIYEVGAWSYSALLGLMCFLAIHRSEDAAVHLAVATTTAGYAAGITGRNAGRPIIAIGQLALAALPLAIALLIYGDAFHLMLGIVILLFVYGMTDITLSIHDVVIQALVNTRAKAALAVKYEEQAKQFDAALNNMSHGLCMFDPNGRLVVWNEQLFQVTGLDRRMIRAGMASMELLRLAETSGILSSRRARRLLVELQRERASRRGGQVDVDLADGRTLALSESMMPGGEAVTIFEDITDRRRAERQVERMARFDELTGLPNRGSFRERMHAEIGLLQRRGAQFAIHWIDLDRFKVVNDTLGHPVGDRLLQAVAERLRSAVRKTDLVARFGGDEFVVVQTPISRRREAAALAERLVEALAIPFEIDGQRIDVGGSVGVCLAPSDGTDADTLQKNADMALYAAKTDGGGCFHFFEKTMSAAAQARRSLELDLREALARGEFELYFQPLVDLKSDDITGCEALLRWKHPERGFVSPAEFIPIAEETGLIIPLSEWVLRAACQEAASWPHDIRVAVNISPVHFKDPTLVACVTAALSQSGLPASRLELEVTETVLLQDSEMTLSVMQQLRSLGLAMSLDDFGTGYSSLSYLRTYPFDKIKIDASFTRGLENDDGSIAIVRAVAGMGTDLGMTIVAEGIETLDELDCVKREGCTQGQGYLLGRPMPAANIRETLGRMHEIRYVA